MRDTIIIETIEHAEQSPSTLLACPTPHGSPAVFTECPLVSQYLQRIDRCLV